MILVSLNLLTRFGYVKQFNVLVNINTRHLDCFFWGQAAIIKNYPWAKAMGGSKR